MLFDILKILHHLPMGHECYRALFRRCTHEELRAWARTLPWDHPIARKLDHEVHRRRMAGECFLLFFSGVGPFFFFPYTFFFDFHRSIQGIRVSTHRVVAYPFMFMPSTCQTQLGRAVLGSSLFMLNFLFVRFMGVCTKSTSVSHLSMGGPSYHWWGV